MRLVFSKNSYLKNFEMQYYKKRMELANNFNSLKNIRIIQNRFIDLCKIKKS